jgi:hypothetical protein
VQAEKCKQPCQIAPTEAEKAAPLSTIYKDMLTSYNGWPASKDPAEIGIKVMQYPALKERLDALRL